MHGQRCEPHAQRGRLLSDDDVAVRRSMRDGRSLCCTFRYRYILHQALRTHRSNLCFRVVIHFLHMIIDYFFSGLSRRAHMVHAYVIHYYFSNLPVASYIFSPRRIYRRPSISTFVLCTLSLCTSSTPVVT